jgi:hypothetical protein
VLGKRRKPGVSKSNAEPSAPRSILAAVPRSRVPVVPHGERSATIS